MFTDMYNNGEKSFAALDRENERIKGNCCSVCGEYTVLYGRDDYGENGVCEQCYIIGRAQREFDEVCIDDDCTGCMDQGTARCPRYEGRVRPEDYDDAVAFLGEDEVQRIIAKGVANA